MSNIVELSSRRQTIPTLEKGKVVTPRRPKNRDVRSREYLTESEVDRLITAARKTTRNGLRDSTLVLMAFRHGLRVTELINLRWDAVHLDTAKLDVSRLKNGSDSRHPLTGNELRALRQLRRDNPDSPFVFVSELKAPMTASNVRKLIQRLGNAAGFKFPVHPHMLRHACGYHMADKGVDTRRIQDYLGHKSITHTVRYTKLSDKAFEGIFKD
jgi:type 1 fimbriae regulatory protein FimE